MNLRALVSRPAVAAVALAAGLVVAGEWRSYLDTVAASTARPATPTRAMRRWKLTAVPATVLAPLIPPSELSGLRRRTGRPDLVSPRPQEAAGATTPGSGPTLLAFPAGPAGAPAAAGGGLFTGQVQREGPILLNEAEDRRPAPAGVTVRAFLETDGRVTQQVELRRAGLVGFPFRWRAWGAVELGSELAWTAGVGLRSVRIGRLELAPGLCAGQLGGETRAYLCAAGWFDF